MNTKDNNNICLVTGGCGFIGSHLVRTLHNAGFPVVVVDDLSTGSPDSIPTDVEFIHKDCNDLDTLYSASYVFHLAAKPRVWYSLEEPHKTTLANVGSTVKMLELAGKEGGVKRFVYSSSSSVYGIKDVPSCQEDMPTNPASPYALQKLQSEQYCKMLGKHFDIPTVIFRYFNVYGKGMPGTGAYSLVIGKFLEQKKRGEKLTIYGDGEQTRDYTHVKDVVRANMLAMHCPVLCEKIEVINIGTGVETSVNELARMIGGKTRKMKNPNEGYEERRKYADTNKARRLLAWSPQIELQDGIRMMQ